MICKWIQSIVDQFLGLTCRIRPQIEMFQTTKSLISTRRRLFMLGVFSYEVTLGPKNWRHVSDMVVWMSGFRRHFLFIVRSDCSGYRICIWPRIKMIQKAKSFSSTRRRIFMLNTFPFEVILRTQSSAQYIWYMSLGLDTTWSWSKDKCWPR